MNLISRVRMTGAFALLALASACNLPAQSPTAVGTILPASQTPATIAPTQPASTETPGTLIPVTGSQDVLLQCQFCVNDEPHAVLILPESAAFLVSEPVVGVNCITAQVVNDRRILFCRGAQQTVFTLNVCVDGTSCLQYPITLETCPLSEAAARFSATPVVEALQRLQTLSQVLKDRPSLQLEISGHVDPSEDYEGLKLAMLQNEVKEQKLAEDAKKGIASGAITDMTLTPEEYSKYLEIAYKKETFEKPRNAIGLAKSLPNAEMEQLILAHTVITANDLQALAENRASAARNCLVEKGEISSERIFIVGIHETEESDQKKGNWVEFSLINLLRAPCDKATGNRKLILS